MEKDFHKVKHLFEDKPFIEGLRSTLGRIPASKQVFVDNSNNPQTAVIVVFPHTTIEVYCSSSEVE
ncbi:MAG: hypothetical protein GPJ52_00915 [Candidatus Heimdallarchaeota archaeon]|nr:hypothetical protein [Candidatus Heimdallarchaeota archaeon]